jgi:photosystem II stability/assembly factor-like uncharacterized protein
MWGFDLYAVSFVDADNGTAVGGTIPRDAAILHTTDGGVTWTPRFYGAGCLIGVSFADASSGMAVGYSGTILRTGNGGDTWTPQTVLTPNPLFAVSFVDANIGIAVGASGTILRTTSGGW